VPLQQRSKLTALAENSDTNPPRGFSSLKTQKSHLPQQGAYVWLTKPPSTKQSPPPQQTPPPPRYFFERDFPPRPLPVSVIGLAKAGVKGGFFFFKFSLQIGHELPRSTSSYTTRSALRRGTLSTDIRSRPCDCPFS